MKLYKFRSLANCQDLTRAQKILETGKFWCSRYWELNDPMEGVYKYKAGTIPDQYIKKLYDEKATYAICSFSGAKAFTNPIVWGYYANGFKGIAIEIEAVVNNESPIKQVKYADKVPNNNSSEQEADNGERILTRKLSCWEHENEYRYLTIGSPGPKKIGTITAVYYGKPYITKVNAHLAKERSRIQEYLCRIEALKKTARVNGIKCRQVKVVKGTVNFR